MKNCQKWHFYPKIECADLLNDKNLQITKCLLSNEVCRKEVLFLKETEKQYKIFPEISENMLKKMFFPKIKDADIKNKTNFIIFQYNCINMYFGSNDSFLYRLHLKLLNIPKNLRLFFNFCHFSPKMDINARIDLKRLILFIQVIYHQTVMSKIISGIGPKMALIIPTPFKPVNGCVFKIFAFEIRDIIENYHFYMKWKLNITSVTNFSTGRISTPYVTTRHARIW